MRTSDQECASPLCACLVPASTRMPGREAPNMVVGHRAIKTATTRTDQWHAGHRALRTLSEVQEGSDVKRDRRPSPPMPLDERSRCCRLCMFEQASSTMPHPARTLEMMRREKVVPQVRACVCACSMGQGERVVERDKSSEAVPEDDILFPLRSKVSSDLLSHSDPAILLAVNVTRSSHINKHPHSHSHSHSHTHTLTHTHSLSHSLSLTHTLSLDLSL